MITYKKLSIAFLLAIILLPSITIPNCSAQSATDERLMTETVASFLTDVMGIDLTQWTLKPVLPFLPHSSFADEEVRKKYTLSCEENSTDVTVYLKNDKVIWCKLYPEKGTINNYIRTSNNAIDHAKIVLEKYRAYSSAPYIQPLLNSLDSITELKNSTSVIDNGNIILKTDSTIDRQTIQWMNTVNGIYNDYDPLVITFYNGAVEHIGDNWNRFPIASGEVKISYEQALALAKEAAYNKISLDVGEDNASNYKFIDGGAHLEMSQRIDVLAPHWNVWLVLDKMVKTYSDALHLFIWADTGELDYIGYAMSYGAYPIDENLTTPQDKSTGNESPTPQTPTLTTSPIDSIRSYQVNMGVMVAVTAIALAVGAALIATKRKRRHK